MLGLVITNGTPNKKWIVIKKGENWFTYIKILGENLFYYGLNGDIIQYDNVIDYVLEINKYYIINSIFNKKVYSK